MMREKPQPAEGGRPTDLSDPDLETRHAPDHWGFADGRGATARTTANREAVMEALMEENNALRLEVDSLKEDLGKSASDLSWTVDQWGAVRAQLEKLREMLR